MQLIIDVGNTRVKAAIFDDDIMITKKVMALAQFTENLSDFVAKHPINKAIISSVGRLSREQSRSVQLRFPTVLLSHKTPLPFVNDYGTPETLGVDRIALVAAFAKAYPGKNGLIIDAGTCITYDFVNEKRQFLGGNISPGLHLRIKGMNSYTDKLPLIDLSEDYSFIGENTEEALNNGVWNGCIGEIEHYCDKFKTEFTNTAIILTGGDTEIFGKALKNTIFANPFLTLIGLNEILLFNRN